MDARDWLERLSRKLDEDLPRIRRLQNYTAGRPDLPEMGTNLREAWQKFQQKAVTDYGGLAVRALASRIVPNGVAVGGGGTPVEAAARRIARDNRLPVQFRGVVRDYLRTGVGYLSVSVLDGRAVVSRERPTRFIAEEDPLRPWMARAGLKLWRDSARGLDFADVWAESVMTRFVRESKNEFGSDLGVGDVSSWDVQQVFPFSGSLPIVVMKREDGEGFIEPHLGVIDRINLGKLNRLVITAMQAFRQRALRKTADGAVLADDDGLGNAVDWAAVFAPAPGALWDLPEGIDIWESAQTDLRPLIDGEKQDAQDFSAVTGTPLSVFLPEGQNQSAEGAANAKELHISQAEEEIERLAPGLAASYMHALRVEGFDTEDETVEVLFRPPAHVSLHERNAAAVQAQAAGVPWRSVMRDVLGYSPERIDEMSAERATEMLQAATLLARDA